MNFFNEKMQSTLFPLIEKRLKDNKLSSKEIKLILTNFADTLPLSILKLINIKEHKVELVKCVNIDMDIIKQLTQYLLSHQIFHENISKENLIKLATIYYIFDCSHSCKNADIEVITSYDNTYNLCLFIKEDISKEDIMKLLDWQMTKGGLFSKFNYFAKCKNWDKDCLLYGIKGGLTFNTANTIEHPNIGLNILISHPEINWNPKDVTMSSVITKEFFQAHINDFPWDIESLINRKDLF